MTMAVVISKDDLDRIFDEVIDTEADVKAQRGAVQVAQEQAEAAKGLTAAAQRELKNAQAKLRVLELGQADAESKDTKYAEHLKQLDVVSKEYADAEKQATAVGEATKALAGIRTALEQWVTKAKQATAAFQSSANTVENLPVTGNAVPKKRTAADALRSQGTSLDSDIDQLWEPQKQRLSNAEQQLKASALSPSQIGALKGRKTRLERQCEEAKPKPEEESGIDSGKVKRARADYEAAKRAVLEAPEVERDTQATLQSAREKLAGAEERHNAALAEQDKAERRLIEDIELIGPGADGFVTAKAKLRYELPDSYSLRWTVDGVSAEPDAEGNIRINTKGLAAGSYVIEVHLRRDSAT